MMTRKALLVGVLRTLLGCTGLFVYCAIQYPKTFSEAWAFFHLPGDSPVTEKTAQNASPSSGDSDKSDDDDEKSLKTTEKRPNEIFPNVSETYVVPAPPHETKVPGMPIRWTLPSGTKPIALIIDGNVLPQLADFGNVAAEQVNARVNVRSYTFNTENKGSVYIVIKHLVFPEKYVAQSKGDDLQTAVRIMNNEKFMEEHHIGINSPAPESRIVGVCAGDGPKLDLCVTVSYRHGEAYVAYLYSPYGKGPLSQEEEEYFLNHVHWSSDPNPTVEQKITRVYGG